MAGGGEGSKEEYEEGPAMGSRNSISFAHRLQIILELPNMGMTWGQLLPPSTIPMPIAVHHLLFRSLHRNLIFHSDSAMGVNCAGLAEAKISARDFSTNSAPAGHSRRPIHLWEREGREALDCGWSFDLLLYGVHTGHNSYYSSFFCSHSNEFSIWGVLPSTAIRASLGWGRMQQKAGEVERAKYIFFFWIGKTCGKWLNYSWRVNFDLDFWKTEHNSSRLMGKTWI